MFSRIRTALGLALLLTLIVSSPVFAKGNFSFITIAGSNLKASVRSTDPALTTDFFAFADFSQRTVKAPSDPGVGYEITRYYIDAGQESAFDHLHYYPDSGYVYFDGLVGGSSDYDGKWYTAKTSIKSIFMDVLSAEMITKSQPVEKIQKTQSNTSAASDRSRPATVRASLAVSILVVSGLLVTLGIVVRRRKASLS